MKTSMLAILVVACGTTIASGQIKVNATVDGKIKEIGSLGVTTGKDKQADNIMGKFEFGKDYTFLDDWYDFRWINVLTTVIDKKTGKPLDAHPLLGKLPGIDPAPTDGKEPYYYNAAEWKAGKFGTTTIREDNKFSLFDDSPNSAQFSDLGFETYLVVDNISDPAWKDNKKFCVLAAFKWTWKIGTVDADKDGDWDDDVSNSGGEVKVDADALKRITTALGNASKGGDFKGWSATTDCNLTACIPAPGSVVLAGLGGVLAWRRRR